MGIHIDLLKIFTLITIYLSVALNIHAATIKYEKNGVLREDSSCTINFINFGINNDVNNIEISKEYNYSGSNFDLRVKKMINANIGFRPGRSFSMDDISNYLIITQNDKSITDFTVVSEDYTNGYFGIKIKNLSTCDGLTLKQTFKDYTTVKTYLLYANEIPSSINKGFSSGLFGPSSNDVPYATLEWDANGGLDNIREECEIFIKYDGYISNNGWHWRWYLSIENINNKKCANSKFYSIAQKYFIDYKPMELIFGQFYEGYVIKRETSNAPHMDGITIPNYIVEVYQNQCGSQNGNQVVCTLSSFETLSFNEFTNKLIDNCVSIIVDQKENAQWEINDSEITGKFTSYTLTINNFGSNVGSLPLSENKNITYRETGTTTNAGGFARFKVNLECKDGTYMDDTCKCN
eukprot:jgi/Orpsp1_1/1184130/evm.model.c7180000088134.1